MPIIDTALQDHYDKMLIEINEEREKLHEPSGKLSSSMLYQPLRFQILKAIGAPRKAMEAYVLGKFQRGNEVEATVVRVAKHMGIMVTDKETLESLNLIWKGDDKQCLAVHKEAIGFPDMIINTDLLPEKKGYMPWEIKSVTNAKLARIAKTGVDYHYKLQCAFCAIAMGVEYFAVVIASGEDNRMQPYIFQTRELASDVDKAITQFNEAMEAWKTDHVLPKFEPNPKVPWTANPQYAMFEPFWFMNGDTDVLIKLKELGIMDGGSTKPADISDVMLPIATA